MMFLGAAVGGGILLSTMLGGRRRGRDRNFYAGSPGAEPARIAGPRRDKAVETWDNVKGALMGVAATRFTDYVGQLVPGFQEHFEREKQKTTQAG